MFAALLILLAANSTKDFKIAAYAVSFSIFWSSIGGWLAVAPASTAKLFGKKNYVKNYGFVFTAYGIGAIFGGIIGYGAYIYVLKHWPASKAGTYSYVNTVIAVILGAVILKEPVNANIIFSIFLIFGGVIAVQISKVKTTESICEKGKND